jgi:single-stranded DNA-binding protein
MIDGLVGGKVHGKAERRTGQQSGKGFVVCKVRAASGAGESVFVNCIAFSESAGAALLALEDGDSVALSGTLNPKPWIDREGAPRIALDMTVTAVMTAYSVKKKRTALEPEKPMQEHLSDDEWLNA